MSGISSDLTGVVVIVALAIFLLLGIFYGTFVIVVVANRADADPTGRRPDAVYGFATAFISLLLAVAGAFLVVSSVVALIGTNVSENPGISPYTARPIEAHPVGDAAARGVVLGLLILAAAGAIHYYNRKRALALVEQGIGPGDPVTRVAQSYASAICFSMTFILLPSAIFAVYSIFKIIGPGVFNTGGSDSGAVRGLLDSAFLAGLTAYLLLRATTLSAMVRAVRRLGEAGPGIGGPKPSGPGGAPGGGWFGGAGRGRGGAGVGGPPGGGPGGGPGVGGPPGGGPGVGGPPGGGPGVGPFGRPSAPGGPPWQGAPGSYQPAAPGYGPAPGQGSGTYPPPPPGSLGHPRAFEQRGGQSPGGQVPGGQPPAGWTPPPPTAEPPQQSE